MLPFRLHCLFHYPPPPEFTFISLFLRHRNLRFHYHTSNPEFVLFILRKRIVQLPR